MSLIEIILTTPDVLSIFANTLLGMVGKLLLIILILSSIAGLLKILYKNIYERNTTLQKISLLIKPFLTSGLKHGIVGCILIACSRFFTALIFVEIEGISSSQELEKTTVTTPHTIDQATLDTIYYNLGLVGTRSLILFIIGGLFVMVCFGNKMVRNIGILFYIAGILVVVIGYLFDLTYHYYK